MEKYLAADIEEYVFENKEVKFLGYIIFEKGVGMAPVRVEAISNGTPGKL